MSFGATTNDDICLGAKLLAGFVGLPSMVDKHAVFKKAENFYNMPTAGLLKTNEQVKTVTRLSPQSLYNPNNSAGSNAERAMLATAAKISTIAFKIFNN